jgi:hypothetical protein
MEVSGQLHALATMTPGKEPPVPIGYEAGSAPEPVWTLWGKEKSCTAGNRTRDVQPVAYRCTDCQRGGTCRAENETYTARISDGTSTVPLSNSQFGAK